MNYIHSTADLIADDSIHQTMRGKVTNQQMKSWEVATHDIPMVLDVSL